MGQDGAYETGIPPQDQIATRGHALQCRITTENPENNFIPDYGRIIAYRGAAGFGLRIDGGTAYSGAVVTRWYDPLLEKVTAWAATPQEAIARMDRALREYRIRGVATNLAFLEAVLSHPKFRNNDYTTRFIDETPELFHLPARRDRASKLLTYVADVTVNGHPETRGRAKPPADARKPEAPIFGVMPKDGTKQLFDRMGAEKFAQWMKAQSQVLVTDTTMRDAHQSLLATRMRGHDIAGIASAYANGLPQLLSLECWGGATFDVAMRFLNEDPWERLAKIRERVPNLLLQMLLRGANGVGYTNYPDNVVRAFVRRTAEAGMDHVPHLRLPQLGREYARCHRCGARGRQAGGRSDLLHRRSVRSRSCQIRPRLLCEDGEGAGESGLSYPVDQGHGGAAQAGPGARLDRCAEK